MQVLKQDSCADTNLWHADAASMYMLCMLSWPADTRQLGEWRTLELKGHHAGQRVDEYTVSWAPCCTRMAITAHCRSTCWLGVWNVSSQGQVLQHLDLSHATASPPMVWTRDSTAVLLSIERGRSILSALCNPPRRSVLRSDPSDITLHAAPYLKGSECMVLLAVAHSLKLVSYSGASSRQVARQDFDCEVQGIACGLTHLAVICQRSLPYLQLFVPAAGPKLVFTHEIQLSIPVSSVPDEDH